MERTNFGEANHNKYLFIYDTNTMSVEKVEIPCKELEEIVLDLSQSEISQVVSELEESVKDIDLTNKIVRMRIAIQQDMSSLIKKKYLENKLYESGAAYVSKIHIENKFRKVARDTSALKEETDYKIFHKFLLNKNCQQIYAIKFQSKLKK